MAANNADKLIEQGQLALNEGRRAEAQELLIRATEIDENNVNAWLLLVSAVDSVEEKRICLENVLMLEPANTAAQRMLEELDRGGIDSATVDDLAGAFDAEPAVNSPPPAPIDDDPFGDTFSQGDFMGDDAGDSFSGGGPFSADFTFSEPANPPAPPPSMPGDVTVDAPELADDDFAGEDEAEAIYESYDDSDLRASFDDMDEEEDDLAADESYIDDSPVMSPVDDYDPRYDAGVGFDDGYDDPVGYVDDVDPLTLLPEDIKPTRLPGEDETISGGLVAGIVIVSLLNIAAIAMLVLQLVG